MSAATVRNRLVRLRSANTAYAMPMPNLTRIPGLIPLHVSYSYSDEKEKRNVYQSMHLHFETRYFSVMFTDPDSRYIFLGASNMKEVQDELDGEVAIRRRDSEG